METEKTSEKSEEEKKMIELRVKTLLTSFTIMFDKQKTTVEEMKQIIQKNIEETNDRILNFDYREI